MSDRVKEIIGEELYNQVTEKFKVKGIKTSEFDIITGNFIPKSRFDEVNSELKSNKEKVTSYEKQINDTKKLLDDNDEYKTKYSELDKKYKTDLELKDKEILNITKVTKVKEALSQNGGGKFVNLLMKEVNLDDITVDGNNLKGFSDVLKNLKTEYKDLFIEKNDSGKPPKPSGEGNNNNQGGQGGDDSKFGIFGQFINSDKL
jgi:hypothetical protein